MINVTIEIAGQQVKLAAANFQMEGKEIFITIAEEQKVKEFVTHPLQNKVVRKVSNKNNNRGKTIVDKKNCQRCNAEFKPRSNGQKYCDECAPIVQKEKVQEYKKAHQKKK
jgi:hypothetical protein